MAEFQPRWTIRKNAEEIRRYSTDSADSLGVHRESVSPVSAVPVNIPKKVLLATPAEPDPRTLAPEEAEAVGLNPRLTWMHVACHGDVEPTEPPLDWDGTLPATCRHPQLCPRLGPCPHALTRCSSALEGA